MHLVAGGFHDQPQGISAVPVLIVLNLGQSYEML